MFAAKKQPTNSNSAKDIDKLRLAKEKKPKKSKEKNVRRVARSVQETIPYERVCTNYIFEVSKNHYSKTYSFSDDVPAADPAAPVPPAVAALPATDNAPAAPP